MGRGFFFFFWLGILAILSLAVALVATLELSREPLVAVSDPLDTQRNEFAVERVDGLSAADSDDSSGALFFTRLVRAVRSTSRKRNNTLTYKKISLKFNTDSSSESAEAAVAVLPSPASSGKRRTKPKSSPQTMIYKPSKNKLAASTTLASAPKITILRPGPETIKSETRNLDKSSESEEQKTAPPVRANDVVARPRPWTTTERPEEKRNKPVEQKEEDTVNPFVRPTKRTRIIVRNRVRDQGVDRIKAHKDIAALRSVQRFRATTSTAATPSSRWRSRRPEGSRSHLFPGHNKKVDESRDTTPEPTTEHLEAEPSIKKVTKLRQEDAADGQIAWDTAPVRPTRPRIRRPENRPHKEDEQQVERPKLERRPPVEIADGAEQDDDDHRKRYEAEKMKQLERLRKGEAKHPRRDEATVAPAGGDPSHSAANADRPHFHANNPVEDSFPRPAPAVERDEFPVGRKVPGPGSEPGARPNVYMVHMPPDKDGAPIQLDEDTAEFTKIFPPPSNFGKRLPVTTAKSKPFKAFEHSLASAPLDKEQKPVQHTPPPAHFPPSTPPPTQAPSHPHVHANRVTGDEQKSKPIPADSAQRYTPKYPSVSELPPGVKVPPRIYTPPEYEYKPPLSYLQPQAPQAPQGPANQHKDYRFIPEHHEHHQHREHHPERPPYPPVHQLPDARKVAPPPPLSPPRVYEPPWKEYEPPAHKEHSKPVHQVHHQEHHVEPPPRTYEPPKLEFEPPGGHHRPGMHSVPPPRDINDVRYLHPFAVEEWHQQQNAESTYKLLPSSSIQQNIRIEEQRHPNRHVEDYGKDHVAPNRPEYPPVVAEPYVRIVSVGHSSSGSPPHPPDHPHHHTRPEVADVLMIPHSEKPMMVTERPYLPERPHLHDKPVVVVTERPHFHDKPYDRPVVVTERPYLHEQQHILVPERHYDRPVVVTERPHLPEQKVVVTERPFVVERPVAVTERPHLPEKAVVVTERPFIVTEKPSAMPQPEKFFMLPERPYPLPEKTYMVVSEAPLTITERPIAVTERPRTITERPHSSDKYPFIEKPPVEGDRPREIHFLVSESEAGRKITPVHIIPPHEAKDLSAEKTNKVPYSLEPVSHKYPHHDDKLEPMVHTRPHNQPRQPEAEFLPIPAPALPSTPSPVQMVHEAVHMALNQRPAVTTYVQGPPYPAPVTHHVTKPPTNYRHDLQFRPSEFHPHPHYYQVPAPLKSPFTEEERRPPKHLRDHQTHVVHYPAVHVTNPTNRPVHAFPAPAPSYQTAASGPVYEVRHYPSSSLVPQQYDTVVSVQNPVTYPAAQPYGASSQQFRLPRQEAVIPDQLAIAANLPTSTDELHKFDFPEPNHTEPVRLHPPPFTYAPNAEGFRQHGGFPVGPPKSSSEDDSGEVGDPSNVPVPGQAGVDYPTYYNIPNLNFRCDAPGYFADPSTRCQVHLGHFFKTFDVSFIKYYFFV